MSDRPAADNQPAPVRLVPSVDETDARRDQHNANAAKELETATGRRALELQQDIVVDLIARLQKHRPK